MNKFWENILNMVVKIELLYQGLSHNQLHFSLETLALKGLFLLFLDKRDEGFETCKKGLKLSLQSHICNYKS